MIFFKKNILRRVFLYFFLLSVTLGVFYVFFQKTSFSNYFFWGGLFLLVSVFLFLFWFEVTRPLKAVLNQMQFLLTGKPYQKIYSERIDEIGVLAHFFNEITGSFEKISNQLKEGKRMLSELEIASDIQKEILPLESIPIKGLDIVAKTRPAVEVGGDTFDFINVKENTFIYIGDVTGHGVPAAIVMTMVHTLVGTFAQIYNNAYDILVQTNNRLKTKIRSTMFMTLVMLHWNSETQKMSYVGAGHEHILVYRSETGICEAIMSGGIALGMIEDNSKIIKEVDLPLKKGDVVVLYSDGIIDAKNMSEERFGLERLKKLIEIYAPEYGVEGILHHVARDFSRFVQNHIQEDDMTLIALRYTGSEEGFQKASSKSTVWNYESTTQNI